ncbi:hypothetical protein [Rhodococcoides yunnanense]|uniref:Uncharacterized protein n=1 Tax=Rhodococcoides yunnanense TaxID=278209 RepID=A0ABU4BKG9_9NOCA|nr:hypothetical protein [Rhodococcus yunnanensis]MDV6264712.1 hypothetical protein [Rhodococcus yunnanensis]
MGDPAASVVQGLSAGLLKFMRSTWMILTDGLAHDLDVSEAQRRLPAKNEEFTRRPLV